MGLLDSLFDQNTYGGQGGGLLDFLRTSQMQQNNYRPSPGFPDQQPSPLDNAQWPAGPQGAPSAPASFADRFNAMPGAPPAFAPSGRSFDTATFDPQTYAPNQAQPIAVGSNYQMPRMGSADQFTPSMNAQAQIPPNAQPTQGQLPPQQSAPQQPQQQDQPLPPAFGGGSILGRIGNPDGLIARLTGNDSRSIAQQNLKAQYDSIRQALIANGDSPQVAASKAMVAAMNPEAAKTILPELFTSKTEIKMVKDALGAEHPYSWNPRDQTFKPVGANGEMSSGAGQGISLLAPGVKEYNPSLSGDAYLGQFGPEVQAAVKAYINGDVMPSGNPRTQAIATKAKEIAQKYGQDMGIPVSDALFAEKRKYRTELGTNSANSAGGQAKAFNQGISHMTTLATTLEKLDNSNGLGIPIIAQGVNATRQGFSTEQSAISDEAKSLGQTVAGEVGKLFSGSAGGGVHEREMTRERFDTVKSKPQLAAALRATLETMQGGLQALEQRRDSILGPNSGVDLVNEATRQNIAKIQGVIDRLEGKSPAPSAAPASALPSGWTVKVR